MKNVINIHSCESIVIFYSDIRDYKDLVGFFERLIKECKLLIPVLNKDLNGNICPSVRSFSVVDNDQSDNVVTTYL